MTQLPSVRHAPAVAAARAHRHTLFDKPIATTLTNPIVCNVKWEGQGEHWMPPEACNLE